MSLLGPLGHPNRLINKKPATVEGLKPGLVENPNFPGEYTLDWGAPTVEVEVPGEKQPAGTEALERVGRIGKVGVWHVFTRPADFTPLSRIRIGAQQYSVLEVSAWPTHVELIVEEVSP